MNQREAKIQAMVEEAKRLGLDLSEELIGKSCNWVLGHLYIKRVVSLYLVVKQKS